MKKKFSLLMAVILVAQFSYAHECDDPNCPFHGATSKIVESDTKEVDDIQYEKYMFTSEYSTNIYKFGFGREDLGRFNSYLSTGNIKMRGGVKFDNKHKVDFSYNTQLNLFPSIIDNSARIKEHKKRIEKDEKALSNTELNKPENAELLEIIKSHKKYNENRLKNIEKEHLKPVPQNLVKFENAHVGYEYNHDDKAKLNISLKFEDKAKNINQSKQYFAIGIKPSYEFKDYIKEGQYIKVNSLKLVPYYEYKSKLNGFNNIRDQYLYLGFTTQLEFPHEVKFDADLSKLISARFNYNPTIEEKYQHKTHLNGEVKFTLTKNFKLYKEGKHELNLKNKASWNAKWAWNEYGKTTEDKDGKIYVYTKNKFLNDEFVFNTKLIYDYKINENLKLASELGLKYKAVKNRDRIIIEDKNGHLHPTGKVVDAKREYTFTPTAQIGLHYDKKINDNLNLYTNLDFAFSTQKEKEQAREYYIEPKFKAGFKYIY